MARHNAVNHYAQKFVTEHSAEGYTYFSHVIPVLFMHDVPRTVDPRSSGTSSVVQRRWLYTPYTYRYTLQCRSSEAGGRRVGSISSSGEKPKQEGARKTVPTFARRTSVARSSVGHDPRFSSIGKLEPLSNNLFGPALGDGQLVTGVTMHQMVPEKRNGYILHVVQH